jgi:hypothetical protein
MGFQSTKAPQQETDGRPIRCLSNTPLVMLEMVTQANALVERPELEDEIIEFISDKMGISSIEDLEKKPFSYLEVIIPEIERIISAGEYEPEVTMPGGGLLFIRNKKMEDGREADFYINRKGTKIEAVSDLPNGDEESEIYYSKDFPFEKYEFTEEEIEETKNIIKAKGI